MNGEGEMQGHEHPLGCLLYAPEVAILARLKGSMNNGKQNFRRKVQFCKNSHGERKSEESVMNAGS